MSERLKQSQYNHFVELGNGRPEEAGSDSGQGCLIRLKENEDKREVVQDED